MVNRVSADLIGGSALVATGVFAAGHAAANYEIGSIWRMGPGMYPMGLGLILAGLGAAIAVGGWFRHTGMSEPFNPRALAAVLGSVAGFAIIAPLLGILPAAVGVVFISVLAKPGFNWLRAIVLALVLVVLSWVVFEIMLNIPFVMARWPF